MFLISLGTFDMVQENFIHFLNFPANDCYWDKRKQLVILRVPTVNTQQKCTAVVLLQQITPQQSRKCRTRGSNNQ